jgi:hypothetical protein
MDRPWNWGAEWHSGLSHHPNITMDFVTRNIDRPWNWGEWGLSDNPNITIEFIEKNLDRDWYWGRDGGLSTNLSITMEFIEKFIDKDWSWSGLSCNTFNYTSKMKSYTQYQAIKKIKNTVLPWLYNPERKSRNSNWNNLIRQSYIKATNY